MPCGVECLSSVTPVVCELSKWSYNLEGFYVLVEIIRCSNADYSVLCGTFNDGSELLS